jgi:hypothetical protein
LAWNRKWFHSLSSEDGLKSDQKKRLNSLSMLKRSSLFPIVEKYKESKGEGLRKVKSSQQIKPSSMDVLMKRMNDMSQEMEALKQHVQQLELKIAHLTK